MIIDIVRQQVLVNLNCVMTLVSITKYAGAGTQASITQTVTVEV